MIIGFQGIKNSYNDYAADEFIKKLKINIKNFHLQLRNALQDLC